MNYNVDINGFSLLTEHDSLLKDLNLHDIFRQYGTKEQCGEALLGLRCHHQTSLGLGAIFHGTKLPKKTVSLPIYQAVQNTMFYLLKIANLPAVRLPVPADPITSIPTY